ncbi:MAG: DUF177 domain-containing protein [Bacteroidales bacterium]|jgi:uncharacterized metal-binding protein YceD (DUF177 family)|nr:DUF177 domain-containing protein [Bacteroidales bacterium]MDD4702711.1 DUF177 domain-containing protein [Bacteroidales bacterium]MDX9797263.1 DUF177 domain-containing protein [Bacteroidales bacterium]
MIKADDYTISFTALEIGEHLFDFKVNKSLFESFENEDVLDLNIDLRIKLIKEERILTFNFDFDGVVNVLCDRCLDPLDFEIEGNKNLFVKFGEEYLEEVVKDDDIMIIPNSEHEINLAHYIYELILLQLPIKCIHPEGMCNEDMIERINNVEPVVEETIDPRWAELQKIKFD